MSHFDMLMERLRMYDEVTLLELLNLTSEEILQKFTERVWERREYIEREVELLFEHQDDEVLEEYDGFEIEEPTTEDDDDPPQ